MIKNISKNKAVRNIAIILDGNRRFARKLSKKPWQGHKIGANKIEKLIDWTKEFKIQELTLFCLSSENLKKRSKKEINYLFKLFKQKFENLDIKKLEKDGIKIRFIGKLSQLPKELQQQCKKLEKQTGKNEKIKVNFAIAYGGRQEIIEAVKTLFKKNKKITQENLQNELWLKNEPDIIIRTGKEKRTSNFLPWQSIYAEWFFLNKLWPEFTKSDLKKCINDFKKRKRNFGK